MNSISQKLKIVCDVLEVHLKRIEMQFPITRAQLQTYHKDVQDRIRSKTIELAVNGFCYEVENVAIHSYPKDKEGKPTVSKCVVRLQNFEKRYIHSLMTPQIHARYAPRLDTILPDVLVELRKKFVGCLIQCDPLQTYVIIDWS